MFLDLGRQVSPATEGRILVLPTASRRPWRTAQRRERGPFRLDGGGAVTHLSVCEGREGGQ